MGGIKLRWLLGKAALPACVALAAGVAHARAGDPVPDSFICTFVAGPISAGSEARTAVGNVGGRVTHVYQHVLHGFSAKMSETAVQKMMAKDKWIESCTQDRLASVPPTSVTNVIAAGKPVGGGGGSTQVTPWGVTRVGGPGSGSGKTAWIVDSGIDLTHPDLNVDAASSTSLLSGDSSPNDAFGHGTHVAGIIGAKNNSIGVVGVAAGARLVAVRVLDASGNGPDSGVIAGIEYAVAHGSPGDVINLSLITSPMPEMDAAVINAGAAGFLVTIAAGNNSAFAGNYSPAEANGANVYTTSAIDNRDTFARYSNYGNPPIDYAEPGSSIQSTYKNGGYATLSGTSMAAPHLAGVLLLRGGAAPSTSGATAIRDPDGHPDRIGVR